ncbi:MAG: DUF4838 domain-containing protein [Clostridia bacterium]|nr:DUF4838 domain-containing protein [Clostridia bacterium]
MMKRLIALLLTVFTLISVIPFSVTAAEMPFKDVKQSHWFYNAVKYTYDRGIFSANNSAGDLFAPNASMTRAMFVTVLFRLSGVDQSTYTGKTVFTDVPQNQWYAKAVQWANEKGYVAGMTETTFSPNGKVTRSQMARILSLYAADQDGYDLTYARESAFNKFADKNKVQDWAKEGITWMSTTGLINGMGTENGAPVLNPNGTATRAQAAQILMGYMEYHNGEYPVGSLTLGDTNLSEFTIVYGETAFNQKESDRPDCKEIADFINGQFKEALGIELSVYRDTDHPYAEGAKEILIGKTNREDAAVTIDRKGIDHNTFIYEMKGDFLILTSNEEMFATYYAATMFLEDVLGITYYGLERFGYTNMKSAHIANGTRVVRSMDFDYCANTQYGGWDYFLGSFTENDVFINASHNLNALGCIDPDCPYATENTISHAHHVEHYLRADPCFTDDDVIDKVIENVRLNLEDELGDDKDRYVHVWLNQDDLGDYCKCSECQKVYRLWGRSAPYVQIMTYVCEALNDEYPNVEYFSYSFRQTATAPKTADQISDADYKKFVDSWNHKHIPPKDITPPSNCTVMVKTDDTACSSHDRFDTTCKKNSDYIKRFEGWCNVFDNVCLHHFLVSDSSPYNTFPNIRELWSDFAFISRYPQATSVRVGAQYGDDSSDFAGMRAYLSSRLYWDKDMTEAQYYALVDDYLKNVYGDGWTYIREFIDLTEELSSDNHWWTYGEMNDWYEIITEAQWRDGNFEYAKELLYTALDLASTESQRREAEVLTLSIDFIECQLAYREGAKNFAELSTAFTEKLTRLGYDIPDNWTADLDPDKWEY